MNQQLLKLDNGVDYILFSLLLHEFQYFHGKIKNRLSYYYSASQIDEGQGGLVTLYVKVWIMGALRWWWQC